MDPSSRVDPEGLRLRLLHTLNIDLEHGSELGPQGHADSVVVKVEYWDLVPLLHQLFEFIVQLNAEENGVDVDSATCAGTCRGG